MKNAYEILKERGFIEQMTHEKEIIDLLEKEKVTFYIGFDATADSLTVGHFVAIMAMAHLQRAGHRPIVLIGGGTTMIGDPSDRTGMRSIMTREQIKHNASIFKKQMSNFLDFSDDKAIMVDNADWLLDLNYVDFLREVGPHFTVNRMLSADCYKSRMDSGLTFFEFNYMLMQSYDFYLLNKKYGCSMQCGGNDQWSNIIGGVELIRRKEAKPAYGMTFKLLTTTDGNKMGKTAKGALWLDKEKTSPYEMFQYFRNVEDAKVGELLAILTFLPMEEVRQLASLKDAEINKAKEVLAYEITKNVHGEEEARAALEASKALFADGSLNTELPSFELAKSNLSQPIGLLDLLVKVNLAPSKSEARRNVQQGGVRVNDQQITDIHHMISQEDFKDNKLLLRKGKKNYLQIQLV